MADYQRQKKGIWTILLAILLFIPWLLSTIALFLSIWIILPAPTFFLLPLGVGAPEISPWLIGVNALALILILFKLHQSWLYNIALIASLLGLLLSVLPLWQFPSANTKVAKEMQTILGQDYLAKVPQTALKQMRRQPFVLADAFRGIPTAEVRIDRHITFATLDNVKLTLNVYRPLATGKYPTIIMIYGGAWRSGTPNNDEKFSCYMASQGYAVIAIDYRHAPKYKFPVQLEDVKTALSYIQTHADSLEVDRDRIALMGRSAGAHLAMLAAYQPDAIPVKAVVNYYGPVNLTKGYYDPPFPDPINTRDVLEKFLGGTPEELKELYQQASPINYVRPNLPPSLLVYAGRDHLVKPTFGRQLYAQLRENGNQVIWLEIPWAEHAFDAVFNGVSNQLALYYTERFLAWALKSS
ncbi:alpha/beta hydrolase [Phormidium sp. LEGE 05292]|uniref:alpha/beta hydrolase n=1 Tax=[Phormidium] sp. LEGE 05292 TaxID=767427 RepID=UPI0018821CC5|nr:alpha/beta hydrolase [Phormidium sp. LEGE 05292]MBE9228779.1 alpha/beta hydrolase [Phormidium sp. LEGE 05292]